MTTLGGQSLMRHIENEDLSAVINLLKTGTISLDERDEDGQSFLMTGSRLGNLPIVRELLSHQEVDVNAVDNDNWTALHNATKEGHLEVVIELLNRGAFIEHRDMGGWTPLIWACYKGHRDVVQELLERGANVNVKGEHHMSCLTWAAGRGYLDIVQLLLAKDAKVNTADKYGTTPLIWAARKGHKEIVDVLLETGAAVDNAGMNSWTALIMAAKGGYTEVVQALLERNPNVNAVDKDGFTALTLAAKDGHIDIVLQLLQKGAYVNLPDRYGDTILIHAVKGGHLEVTKALLKKYADIDVEGGGNKSALYWAVEKGHVAIARALLDYNADTEISNKDGDTPLLKATRSRIIEMVELLLEKGARVSAMDKRGDTALTIAVRARSKRITELLLRNPKDSRLLYKPNKAGQTPYQIDAAHQKSILSQIFGARHLNAEESIQGYDLYSSTIADVLSDPALKTPITVGLYAKWGSGKSFLIDKLEKEMKSFTQHSSDPVFEFSWLQFFLSFILSLIVGMALTFTLRWEICLGVGLGVFLLQYIFLVLVWFGSHRRDWSWAERLSTYLAIKMQFLQLLLQVVFCNEPRPASHDTASVRFLFTDNARLASVVGEKSITAMIGTLCDALEDEYGALVTRLYRVFKPAKVQDHGRFKSLCCIPYFVIVVIVIICAVTVGVLLALFGVHSIMDRKYTAVDSVLITVSVIVGVAVVANMYTWGRMVVNLVVSPRRRVEKIASQVDSLKVEGFMQNLKREVEWMGQMTRCMDSFLGNSTRLVVIVDGLDSCEQERLLSVLDTVHMLFGDMAAPFITILAVDPHVIIKGIEHNLHGLFRDSSINGHDYLRNIVHLPFFLQTQLNPRVRPLEDGKRDTGGDTNHVGGGSGGTHRFTRQESAMGSRTSLTEGSGKRRSRANRQSSFMGGSALNRHGSTFDLTKTLVKNSYFSDINPRNMRRLMNIVGVTGRLLRAFQVDFSWHRLAAWINVTEQWPYRLSWVIMETEDNEDFDNSMSLKTIFENRVLPKMPISKDIDPLLEIDRNPQKLEIFLSNYQPLLNVGDLRKFLPCTINVDPYLRKLIREMMQNADNITSEFGFNPLQAPSQVGPVDMTGLGHWAGTLRRPQSRLDQFAAHISPRATPTRFSTPRMGYTTPLPFSVQQPPYQFPMAAMAQNQLAQMQMAPYMLPYLMSQSQQAVASRSSPKIYLQGGDKDIILSQLSVDGVCSLLDKLEGLNPGKVDVYKEKLVENNISGVVLLHCDLPELKSVMGMTFGDWELFRAMVDSLREREAAAMMGKGRGVNGSKEKFVRGPSDEDGSHSPHISFTADVPPKEKKLEAPRPFYPNPSVAEIKSPSLIERGVTTSEPCVRMEKQGSLVDHDEKEEMLIQEDGESSGEHRPLSQQGSGGSVKSLIRDDFVDEFFLETQSIHEVMEDMGLTDDERDDETDEGDSEVYDTVIHMPDDRRPEIPATMMQDTSRSKFGLQNVTEGESSLMIPMDKPSSKSPAEIARAKFIVSAARVDSRDSEMGDLINQMKDKHNDYLAAAANLSPGKAFSDIGGSQTLSGPELDSPHAAAARFDPDNSHPGSAPQMMRSPRYSSDSSSASDNAVTTMAVTADINTIPISPDRGLAEGDFSQDPTASDPTTPLLQSSSTQKKIPGRSSRERLGPKLMERLQKLSMDLEDNDPELIGLTDDPFESSGLSADKTPLMTPATSREHLNVRKANKVQDETGPSAFQVVTPGSSRASSLAASAASSRGGSLSGTPLPVSPAVMEGIDHFPYHDRSSRKKISPAASGKRGSTGSLGKNKEDKDKAAKGSAGPAGKAVSPGAVGLPVMTSSPSGLRSLIASSEGSAEPTPPALDGKDVMVNIEGQTVKTAMPKDETFI